MIQGTNSLVNSLKVCVTASPLLWLCANKAQAADYTKCVVPQEYYVNRATEFCIPESQGQTKGRIGSGNSFEIGQNQSGDPVVLVLPARNCRQPTRNYLGDLVLVLDSSQSLEKTDPNDERFQGTEAFLDELQRVTSQTPNAPAVGVVNYGGRIRFTKPDPGRSGKPKYVKNPDEAYSPEYENIPCANGDNPAVLAEIFKANSTREALDQKFDSDDARARWKERVDAADKYPLSICEFLEKVNVKTDSRNDLSIPGLTRLKEFMKLPEGEPRGATDVSYMIETAASNALLGGSAQRSMHAIFVTDGLPNMPVRRTKDYCLKAPHLPKSDFDSDDLSPVDELFCLDRNFRTGVNLAHSSALSLFKNRNLHHILYWSKPDESFIDFDEQGTLNPADFLIENSARTGNGKVKFKFAQGPENLKKALVSLIPSFDQAALQRVDITVTDATGVTRPKYSAVSPLGFPDDANNPQDKRFDLKILYLKVGENKVLVEYIYSDQVVSETLTVKVNPSFVSTSAMSCTSESSSFTVDGDRKDYPVCLKRDKRDIVPPPPPECRGAGAPSACTCKAPEGDGFLPFPDENGNIRVYRNADPTNKEFESQDQFADVRNYGTEDGKPGPQNLRIQGGTGNCGVVAGLDANSVQAVKANRMALLLLLLPLLFAGMQIFLTLLIKPFFKRLRGQV